MFRRRETETERTLLRLVENLQRQNQLLVDQIIYLSGKEWTPPPAAAASERVLLPDEVPVGWTAQPEQDPVY